MVLSKLSPLNFPRYKHIAGMMMMDTLIMYAQRSAGQIYIYNVLCHYRWTFLERNA